jgi:hypothetical protein
MSASLQAEVSADLRRDIASRKAELLAAEAVIRAHDEAVTDAITPVHWHQYPLHETTLDCGCHWQGPNPYGPDYPSGFVKRCPALDRAMEVVR